MLKKEHAEAPHLYPLAYSKVAFLAINHLPQLIPFVACHICLSKNAKASVITSYRDEASAAVARSNKI